MNCPNCNVGIADGATFCFDCNTKIPVEAIGQQNPAVAAAGTGDRVGSLSLGRIDAGRSTAGGVGTNRQRALAVLPGSPSTRRSPAPSSSATGVSAEIKGTLASGADELSTLASKDGYELLAMVGLSQHGKSEFMYSFLKTITQSRGRDQAQAGGVMNRGAGPESVRRTDPGNYYGWRVPVRDRLFAVWDIAGEDFESIADQRALRVKQDLSLFLRRVLPLCRGLILTISLPKLWAAWNDPEHARSDRREKLDANVNTYVRFLEFAHVARSLQKRGTLDRTGADDYLTDEAIRRHMKRAGRLDIPVVVNFSMADACTALKTPEVQAPRDRLIGTRILPSVTVSAERVDAMLLAYLYLQPLFNHLSRHVRWFKFDFSQAFNTGDIEKHPDDLREVRGCESMHMFLCDMNWRGRFGSTEAYLGWYRRVRAREWAARIREVVES